MRFCKKNFLVKKSPIHSDSIKTPPLAGESFFADVYHLEQETKYVIFRTIYDERCILTTHTRFIYYENRQPADVLHDPLFGGPGARGRCVPRLCLFPLGG